MSDEELRKTAKGNTYVPDVWVTHHDTDWGPHLWSANIAPWDEDYDAPITGWADNTHFVNADRIVAAEARIEALNEQLEAARDDAKEAEAYAEGLERDLKTCCMAQTVMDNTVAELEKENTRLSGLMSERGQMLGRYDQMVVDGAKREEAWKAKLAKAVEGLRLIGADENENWQANTARATLAEIKGEKG